MALKTGENKFLGLQKVITIWTEFTLILSLCKVYSQFFLYTGFPRNRVSSCRFPRHMFRFVLAKRCRNTVAKRIETNRNFTILYSICTLIRISVDINSKKDIFLFHTISLCHISFWRNFFWRNFFLAKYLFREKH